MGDARRYAWRGLKPMQIAVKVKLRHSDCPVPITGQRPTGFGCESIWFPRIYTRFPLPEVGLVLSLMSVVQWVHWD